MPPVTRLNDIGLGHDSFDPTQASSGSDNVFVNCLPTVRKGDSLISHGSSSPSPAHERSFSSGSSTVMANNKPVVRIGDSIDCGGLSAEGSENVICGG